MSQMIASYRAYLEKWKVEHPHVPKPKIVVCNMFDTEDEDLLYLTEHHSKRRILTHTCKVWDAFGEVAHLPDGRVFEILNKDNKWLFAIFLSLEDWKTYDSPMTIRQYHDIH